MEKNLRRGKIRRNMRKSCLALAVCSLGVSQGLQAAETNQEMVKLQDVIVTDTKIAQPQETVTQKVTVVYEEDMDKQTASNRNISELFKYEGGQFVNPLSRNDANWGSYGGLGPKYNSYLLDGLPIDSFVDTMSLDPWAFDRAELHKGPASVLYSNYLTMDFAGNQTSLAGTTNLILKDKIDQQATRILAGYGSWNTLNTRAYHQDHKDNWHYFFGVNYEKSDYANYGTIPSWLNMIDDPSYEKTKIYGKVSYYFDKDDHLSLFVHHTDHTGDAGRPNRDYDHSYDTINLDYFNQLTQQINLQVKTGYRGYHRAWNEDNYPTNLALREHDGVDQDIFPSDLTVNIKHSGNSILTAGVDSQIASYETYAETNGIRSIGNNVDAKSYGVFLQDKYLLLNDKLVLRGGGRFNRTEHSYDMISGGEPGDDSHSWNKFLWSAGARYNFVPQVAVYTNVGTSFMAPSAKSVGGTLRASDFGVVGKNGQLPNPDLDPESGIAYDAGMDFEPTKNLKLGIRGFLNKVDDAIVENVVSANPSQTKSINAGEATSYGVEITIDHKLTESLKWFANMTYTSTEVKNSLDPDQDGSDLSFSPDYLANLGVSATLPYKFTISPYLQWVGNYYDSTSISGRSKFGSYAVLNLKIEKTVYTTPGYELVATLDLNNLTDNKYEMPWQFQDPGFNAFASLELRF
jgi:iron complex outermembrane recepter protein